MYHSRTIPVSEDITATVYLFPCTIFEDIKTFPAQRYIKKEVFRILQYPKYSKKEFLKNSEFKASQLLIDKKHQFKHRFITDI